MAYHGEHMGIETIAVIIALIISIIMHEVAHGYAANWLGDPTARLAGRLSPNPLVHIDPLGSVIIPALLFISNAGILFGWAKPVPYNPYNLNNQKWGEAIVSAAGPLTNILLAAIFAGFIRFAVPLGLSPSFLDLASYIVYINILLAFFNLIPMPPLDGAKILESLLPYELQLKFRAFADTIARFGLLATFLFIFIFIQIFWAPFFALVMTVFTFFTGLSSPF